MVLISNQEKEQVVVGKHAKDINLKGILGVVKKRLWIVVLITIITTTVGYFASDRNHTPLYETSTRIVVETDDNYMSTLMVMIKDPIIMQKVKDEMNLSRSPESIAGQIEVTRIDESQVIMISVTDQSPAVAMNIANMTAETFKSEAKKILDFKDVQLLSGAKQNSSPINETKNKTVLIAFVLGLVIGVGLIFLVDSLDETVDKEFQVEEILGVPVIGVISNMKKVRKDLPQKRRKDETKLRSDEVGVIE